MLVLVARLTFVVELKPLHNLALDSEGIDFDKATLNVCSTCQSALERRTIPELSLKNNLEVGPVPECLSQLTWAEQRLIAIYRIHIHMVHFRNDDVPGQKDVLSIQHTQPHFRGAAICVPQDILAVQALLPPPPSELPKYFQVGLLLLTFHMAA